MGRSEGKARLKNILLGQSEVGLKSGPKKKSLLSLDLEKEIKELVAGDFASTRDEFYQPITLKLAQIDPELLIKDKTFLMLLKKENQFLKKDIGFPLNEDNLDSLAKDFAYSFKNHRTPHLGRSLLNSSLFAEYEKEHIINAYFTHLNQLIETPALFYQFAFRSALPLAQDDAFKDLIYDNLAESIALLNRDRASVSRVIKSLTTYEKEIFRTKELENVTGRVREFLEANTFSDNFSFDALQDSINLGQKEVVVGAVFSRLAKNEKLLRKADSSKLQSKSEQVKYLKEVLNNTGLFKKESSFAVVSSIYFLIGGERRSYLNELRPLFKQGSLTPEQIYTALDNSIAGWVPTSHLTVSNFYNHSFVFLEAIEADLKNN